MLPRLRTRRQLFVAILVVLTVVLFGGALQFGAGGKSGIKWFGEFWHFRTEGKAFVQALKDHGGYRRFSRNRPQLVTSFRIFPGRPEPDPVDERLPRLIQLLEGQVGEPYVWGAAGPDSFDCSGLVVFAFGEVYGMQLPHFTGSLVQLGEAVPYNALQPGDLVFFGDDYHHMGVFVGEGQYIHAPYSGATVTLAPLSDRYPSAIRRLL